MAYIWINSLVKEIWYAAVWGVYGGSTLTNRLPISVLVTNFNRKGLNSDELETFVHEFGHALHGILSNTRYTSQSGTSVERDFVEAPSQMYEEWARRKETLSKVLIIVIQLVHELMMN